MKPTEEGDTHNQTSLVQKHCQVFGTLSQDGEDSDVRNKTQGLPGWVSRTERSLQVAYSKAHEMALAGNRRSAMHESTREMP